MNRVMTVLFLCVALLLTATSVWADVAKEKELQMRYEATDVDPMIGPLAPTSTIDDQWDMLAYYDMSVTGSVLCLGVEFADNHWYVTHSGASSGSGADDRVAILDRDGNYLSEFPQIGTSSWGYRDLAYDGTYLYASGGTVIKCHALDGTPVPAFDINGPENPNRALAYDPVLDHFWTANFSSPLYEFDRTGAVAWSGPSGVASVYGAAWDDFADDGPWLWLHSQTGSPGCTITKFDPINHVVTAESYNIPLPPGYTTNIAGGLCFTSEWDQTYWTFAALGQGSPQDNIMVLEMYDNIDPDAPAAVENFIVANNGPDLIASLSWDNPTLTFGGGTLTSITSVEVLRDGSPLVTLTGTPGQAMTYDDNVPAAGLYEYAVYCVNAAGNGPQVSDSEPIGLDVPAGVDNLFGEGVGEELIAELTWDNPTTGAYGGYFPPGSIDGIIINRYGPSTATFNVGVVTSYTDNTVPVQGFYQYGVICYNSTGNGPEMMTDLFYVGPPEYEPVAYDWVEISTIGTNTGITGDDQNLGPFPMGFSFPWYDGAIYNSIRVCSNGFLSFTSTSTDFSNNPIPDPPEPNNLVAPYWDDFYPPGGGSIWYYQDTANNRFIVEFYQVPLLSGGGSYTFEAIFYPDGTIDYMYNDLTPGTPNSCTVGVENGTGTVGVQCTYNGSGPLEPAPLTGIRIYPVGVIVTHDVTITLTPYGTPIQIPAAGGSFDFNVALSNNETDPVTFDAWIMAELPNGSFFGPILGPVNLTLPGSTSIDRDRTQAIPAHAPAGTYNYWGYVGIYPDNVWDDDSFPFEKLTTGDGPMVTGWECTGEGFDQWMTSTAAEIPSNFVLNGVYPNPFNPTTTISFSLPEASKVTLSVYDVSGRMVARLVDGWRDAGVHEAIFDGANLASGVYIYNLSAGQFNATGKMIMMK